MAGERAVAVMNEEHPRGRQVVLSTSQLAVYLHVDDGIVASALPYSGGSGRPACDQVMEQMADGLEELGFRVPDHERRRHGDIDKVVGYEPEEHPARVRVPARKAALIFVALCTLTRERLVNT